MPRQQLEQDDVYLAGFLGLADVDNANGLGAPWTSTSKVVLTIGHLVRGLGVFAGGGARRWALRFKTCSSLHSSEWVGGAIVVCKCACAMQGRPPVCCHAVIKFWIHVCETLGLGASVRAAGFDAKHRALFASGDPPFLGSSFHCKMKFLDYVCAFGACAGSVGLINLPPC